MNLSILLHPSIIQASFSLYPRCFTFLSIQASCTCQNWTVGPYCFLSLWSRVPYSPYIYSVFDIFTRELHVWVFLLWAVMLLCCSLPLPFVHSTEHDDEIALEPPQQYGISCTEKETLGWSIPAPPQHWDGPSQSFSPNGRPLIGNKIITMTPHKSKHCSLPFWNHPTYSASCTQLNTYFDLKLRDPLLESQQTVLRDFCQHLTSSVFTSRGRTVSSLPTAWTTWLLPMQWRLWL
jgi:hypothetical protein